MAFYTSWSRHASSCRGDKRHRGCLLQTACMHLNPQPRGGVDGRVAARCQKDGPGGRRRPPRLMVAASEEPREEPSTSSRVERRSTSKPVAERGARGCRRSGGPSLVEANHGATLLAEHAEHDLERPPTPPRARTDELARADSPRRPEALWGMSLYRCTLSGTSLRRIQSRRPRAVSRWKSAGGASNEPGCCTSVRAESGARWCTVALLGH